MTGSEQIDAILAPLLQTARPSRPPNRRRTRPRNALARRMRRNVRRLTIITGINAKVSLMQPKSRNNRESYQPFVCPHCGATRFGTLRLEPVQILACHGKSSDGPPFGCGWRGTWHDVRRKAAIRKRAAGKPGDG